MKDSDLPEYIAEVREVLQNHADHGAVIMCFKSDPTDVNAVISTGSMYCSLQGLTAAKMGIEKAIEELTKEMRTRGLLQ